jgi:hypothetical protein
MCRREISSSFLEENMDIILIVLVVFLLSEGAAIGDIGGGDNNDLYLPTN